MKQFLILVIGCVLVILVPQSALCSATGGWVLHVVDTDGDTGLNTAITLDSMGNPFISYHDHTNGTLKLARFIDSTWELEIVDDTQDHVGHYAAIELDAFDNPCISYGRFLRNVGWLKYAAWNGTGWQLETIDTKAQTVGKHTSLALDLDGTPHISYTSFGNQYLVKHAWWTGTDWETELVHKGGGSGGGSSPEFYLSGTSIVLDDIGTPCIAFWGIGEDANVDYACNAGTDWNVGIIDFGWSGFGSSNSLVLDNSGVPHISYYHRETKDLRYARWNPTTATWDVQVVDSTGDVGLYSSIDVDSGNAPQISYYDETNGVLKFARWDPVAGWDVQIVDATAVVGLYTSVAVDSHGAPHISYYDQTNGDLKYAVAREACASNADCNDGNECTIDTCDTGTGFCSNTAASDNTTCNAGAGICCQGICTVFECAGDVDCDDNEMCTTDQCMSPGICDSFCVNTYPDCAGQADGCCGPGCDYSNDPDCPECVPTHSKEKGPRCSDGIDNDCDGLIDGNDPDCG